jgi:hypothetical protein
MKHVLLKQSVLRPPAIDESALLHLLARMPSSLRQFAAVDMMPRLSPKDCRTRSLSRAEPVLACLVPPCGRVSAYSRMCEDLLGRKPIKTSLRGRDDVCKVLRVRKHQLANHTSSCLVN